MSFRFNNRLSSGKFGTVSARNICNTARIRKGYYKWSQKRPLVEKSTVESDIPVKRVTRSATVRASAKEIITIKFSSMNNYNKFIFQKNRSIKNSKKIGHTVHAF